MNLAFSLTSSNPSNPIIVQSSATYSSSATQRDVFESHRHHIFSVAYYMTGDEREAEAILGATFIESFQRYTRPSTFDLDRALLAELGRRVSLDPVPAMSAGGGVGLGGANVRRTDLEEAVWQLPALERYCFLMHDVEGSSAMRIAGLLQMPEDTVRRTLISARIRIRSLLAAAIPPKG